MAVITRRKIRVEEYHRMAESGILGSDEKVELLRGEIIQMSPIGSKHSLTVARINRYFVNLLGESVLVWIQSSIQLGEFNEPEPDISLLINEEEKYEESLPKPEDVILIIEVADSSLEKDRGFKLPEYAKSGIPQYWIVNLNRREVEVYQDPMESIYRSKKTYEIDESVPFLDKYEVEVARFFS